MIAFMREIKRRGTSKSYLRDEYHEAHREFKGIEPIYEKVRQAFIEGPIKTEVHSEPKEFIKKWENCTNKKCEGVIFEASAHVRALGLNKRRPYFSFLL